MGLFDWLLGSKEERVTVKTVAKPDVQVAVKKATVKKAPAKKAGAKKPTAKKNVKKPTKRK